MAALDMLMAEWLGPSALGNLYADRGDEPVREAIRAIAEEQVTFRPRPATFTPAAVAHLCPNSPHASRMGVFAVPREHALHAVLTPDGAQQLLTTAQAATLLGVTAATIRKWAQLGHIHATGLDQAGRKLYRLIDVAQYEKTTRIPSGRENRDKRLGYCIPA
jgi:excisionase family DNA binding protein